MESHDVVVVGAGHNALVAAAYLTQAGRSVLVLDRNDRTHVPNLYTLGAGTWPGGGVPGASGHIVARLLLDGAERGRRTPTGP